MARIHKALTLSAAKVDRSADAFAFDFPSRTAGSDKGDKGRPRSKWGSMKLTSAQAIGIWLRLVLAAILLVSGLETVRAATEAVGSARGLALPRFVSLRYDKTNVREGPSKSHRTSWIFQRASLPVEITAESDTWRRIRDAEGS